MKTATITLGGKTYTVAELPLRQNAAWRKRLSTLIASITDLVGALQIDLKNTNDLASVINQVRNVLLEAPDQVTELLFDYAPELAADRVRINNEVYESELLAAFTEVLKLAYPLGNFFHLASGLTPKDAATTSTS